MEDKCFDEALVERVAKALHALGFISPSPSSTEVSELWDKSPTNYKIMHRIQAKYVLSSLSSTHAIVPKEEYEETVRLLRRVSQLQKVKIDSAIDQHPGEQAAAWGDDWAALLEAIAVHIAKEASPNGR